MHGLARDPGDGTLYVATHEGLFSYADGEPELVGPVMDLMGFAISGPGEFVASGHQGADSELPEPMGLIRSDDAGRSWEVASRGGESDFHELTTAGPVVMAFDGALRSTEDGTTWTEAALPELITDLALSPTGRTCWSPPSPGCNAARTRWPAARCRSRPRAGGPPGSPFPTRL